MKSKLAFSFFPVRAATPRDEPLAFALGAADEEAARSIAESFEAKRNSGEFEKIVAQMRLE